MKTCSICKKSLPYSDFPKRSRSKDGYASSCKECKKEVNKSSYARYKNAPETKQFRKVTTDKSFASEFPLLCQNWDYANNSIAPTEVSPKNSYKAAWRCGICGYSWTARLNKIGVKGDRTYCPKCEGTVSDSVLITHPEIIHWVADRTILSELSRGSNKTVTFNCPQQNHSFDSSVKKFSFVCPLCFLLEKSIAVVAPHLVAEWSPKNILKPGEISYASKKLVSWVCSKGHEWQTPAYQRTTHKTGCPQCASTSFSSAAEKELLDFIQERVDNPVLANDRKVLNGQELDIYLPEQKLAIEFNGLYWHSEDAGKGKWYHRSKWAGCKEQGIQLIQIWEDDWNRNPEMIKGMLAHKLGSAQRKVYARKTQVTLIPQKGANIFLEANHIQGGVDGSIRVGLTCDDELVALLVLKQEPGTQGRVLNLLRFATSRQIPGGFTKLLKAVISTHPMVEEIITFSDNAISDGGLYQNNGFTAVKDLPPDYSYVVNGSREHKFNYRISRFKADNGLLYEEGLSESELARLNNLPKIWDCGKIKWSLRVTKKGKPKEDD